MEWLKYVECKWVDCGNECGEVTVKMINSLSSSFNDVSSYKIPR